MKGSCLCGRIIYDVKKLASPIQHCACHTCRKAHSAAFNTGAAVELDDFAWIKGDELLTFYNSSPGKYRYFCSNCGTQLIKKIDGRNQLILRVATLDEDPQQIPIAKIWASHQVPWLHYGDDIPEYAEAK